MAFTKITQADVNNKGVIGLPDTPGLTTTEIQQKFDQLALEVLMPKHNALIDELEAGEAGASIGVKDADNEDTTLQARLDGIAAEIEDVSLEALTDTNITNPTDGQALIYDATSEKWINGEGGGASSADDVSYDNTTSGLEATNVQDAIDEVYGDIPTEPTVYTQTLVAGNTSVAFTDVVTTANSLVDVGTSVAGLDYNSISVSGTTYTVSFDTQASNVTVYLIVSEI